MSQRAKQDTVRQDTVQPEHAGQPGLVAFVGTGPGSTELLTVRAAELLGRADLVAASAEVIEQLRDLLAADAEIRDVAGSRPRTCSMTSGRPTTRSARPSSSAARTVSSSVLPGPVPTKATSPGWPACPACAVSCFAL